MTIHSKIVLSIVEIGPNCKVSVFNISHLVHQWSTGTHGLQFYQPLGVHPACNCQALTETVCRAKSVKCKYHKLYAERLGKNRTVAYEKQYHLLWLKANGVFEQGTKVRGGLWAITEHNSNLYPQREHIKRAGSSLAIKKRFFAFPHFFFHISYFLLSIYSF